MSLLDDTAKPVVRNALTRAVKRGLTLVQGQCEQVAACAGWKPDGGRTRTAPGRTCCVLCALVTDFKIKLTYGEGSDAEEAIAEYLGVQSRNWVISLCQGFDGERNHNGEDAAYRLGQHFWRLFGN